MKTVALSLTLIFVFVAPLKADIAADGLSALDPDNLRLGSVAAVVVDRKSDTTLYARHADAPMPIASITKLMTAMVVLDSDQSLEERIEIVKPDLNTRKNAYSRMRIGSRASRGDLLRIALMSSENLAAWVLGYHYPGGLPAFVDAMNNKAKAIGMTNTRFADTTGLLVDNRSTAADLARMVDAAADYALIRKFTTTSRFHVRFSAPGYTLGYVNTNPLVRRSYWDVALSKTGYLTEAGRCLVMITEIDDREVTMVLLNSFGTKTPIGDAGRIRRWIKTGSGGHIAAPALRYARQRREEIEHSQDASE